MAKSSRYRVQLRRRRQRKTDYQARKAFVLSGKPRVVSRSSIKNTTVQIIIAKSHGDEVLASAHTHELVKYGWKAATGNLPAAYLTGLLCGLKAKAKGVTEAILDIGLVSPTKGSKVFTVLSGVLDAGISVPHDGEKIVKERAEGEHIVSYAESLGTPEVYAPRFSTYISKGLSPETLSEHFAEVKTAILAAFGVTSKVESKAKAKPKIAVKPEAKSKPEARTEAKPAPTSEVKAAAKVAISPASKAASEADTVAKQKNIKAAAKPKKASDTADKPADGETKPRRKSSVKKTEKSGGEKE